MDTTLSDLVQVAVPRRHLIAVYGLLAQLEQSGVVATDTAAGPIAEEEVPSEAGTVWTVEDLRRFAATPSATSATIGKVLDVLAENPGQWQSTTVLENATGVPRANLKGAFSALTRHLRAHYDGAGWMLNWVWGPELGADHRAETHYTLTAEQADRWKQARHAA